MAAPLPRALIAIEKLAGHVTALLIAAAIIALAAWAAGAVFAAFPGDKIPATAALSFGVGIALKALMAGSVAFALATCVARASPRASPERSSAGATSSRATGRSSLPSAPWPTSPGSAGPPTTCRSPAGRTGGSSASSRSCAPSCSGSASSGSSAVTSASSARGACPGCRGCSSGSAGQSAVPSARCSPRASPGASAWGSTASSWRPPAGPSSTSWRGRRASWRWRRACSRAWTGRRRSGSSSCSSWTSGSCSSAVLRPRSSGGG